MSLCVDVYVVGEDDQMRVLDVPASASDLAGFESWRTTVWGSDAVRALGARFFPALATGELVTVAPDEVDEFLGECALIRRNLEHVTPAADSTQSHATHVQQISQRLKNIEDAAERAKAVAGGVLIW
ncbi:hypothetical protein NGF19_17990 [Streptomyces sp. RY43-2]|uniref:Uncharacterized protein n=1 Tax=Streptomyces macrolidinus TaxID=2952607 RepID=A0ABT0ZGH1_9ACTN|nr:hypothetical protein [Streptomyces macrolidinus]MCN9242663.1 hypothetical protein [Streptomyces macrolidinus]